jgi:tetratricopeptide (TPR) repeat protein
MAAIVEPLQELLAQLENVEDYAEFLKASVVLETKVLQSNNAALLSELGLMYQKWRLWDRAEKLLKRATRIEPSLPTLHSFLGILFMERDDQPWEDSLEMAKSAFETAIHAEKLAAEPSAATHTLLGRVYFSLGDQETAVSEFRTALTIEPQYAEAKYNLAIALLDQQRPSVSEAIELLRQCVHEDPQDFTALRDLGWELRNSDREESEHYLLRALEGAEGDVLAHIYYARLKFDTEPAIAEHHYRRAVLLDSADPELHRLLGLFYQHHGKLAEANRELFAAMELKPAEQTLNAYTDFLRQIEDKTVRLQLYRSSIQTQLLSPEMLRELERRVTEL